MAACKDFLAYSAAISLIRFLTVFQRSEEELRLHVIILFILLTFGPKSRCEPVPRTDFWRPAGNVGFRLNRGHLGFILRTTREHIFDIADDSLDLGEMGPYGSVTENVRLSPRRLTTIAPSI